MSFIKRVASNSVGFRILQGTGVADDPTFIEVFADRTFLNL